MGIVLLVCLFGTGFSSNPSNPFITSYCRKVLPKFIADPSHFCPVPEWNSVPREAFCYLPCPSLYKRIKPYRGHVQSPPAFQEERRGIDSFTLYKIPYFPLQIVKKYQTGSLFALLVNCTNCTKVFRCTCLNIWFNSGTVTTQRQRELTQRWKTYLSELYDEETSLDRGSGSH